MCITVDDMPTVSYGLKGTSEIIIRELVNTFRSYNVPAIGYVNESKLFKNNELDSTQIEYLKHWLSNGLELGNHTFSHYSYHKTSFKTFTEDIVKGEIHTKQLSFIYNLPYRFFRHPFLQIGKNKARADSLNIFLKQLNYEVAPVSIDNADYLFAAAYARCYRNNDEAAMKRIGNDYVLYMLDKVEYFEAISDSLFQRNINHILLTHANLLNAHYMGDLLQQLQEKGYSFIDQQEANSDPAYTTEITSYGHWGISWLERWALSMGKKGDFFRNDPAHPAYIESIYK